MYTRYISFGYILKRKIFKLFEIDHLCILVFGSLDLSFGCCVLRLCVLIAMFRLFCFLVVTVLKSPGSSMELFFLCWQKPFASFRTTSSSTKARVWRRFRAQNEDLEAEFPASHVTQATHTQRLLLLWREKSFS